MHGGAQAALLMHLFSGHLTLLAPKFDADQVWRTVEKEKVQLIFMTGDAMARPLIEAYVAGDYDASSVVAVASSAATSSRASLAASPVARWTSHTAVPGSG